MTTALTTTDEGRLMEQVLMRGDLKALTPEQRTAYYLEVCKSLDLNYLTKPFEYLELGGKKDEKKLVLYATRTCTDQLRTKRGIKVCISEGRIENGVYIVRAKASDRDGREDESTGAVSVEKENGEWKTAPSGRPYFKGDGTYRPLRGDEMANAIMKAETKAKRRVTLSIVGLGWLDESEVDSIPGASRPEIEHPPDAAPPNGHPAAQTGPTVSAEQLDRLKALCGSMPDERAKGWWRSTSERYGVRKPADLPACYYSDALRELEALAPPTPEQLQRIDALCTEFSMSPRDRAEFIVDAFGVEYAEELTTNQADELIARREARPIEQNATPA